MRPGRIVIILCAMMMCSNRFEAQSQSASMATQNLDSLARLYNIELSKITSPALEERKRVRREMQRRGYSTILSDVLMNDGFAAIISYIKTKLLIEYSISHRPLHPLSVMIAPNERTGPKWVGVPLEDDWTFPVNPWEKK